MNTSRNKTLSPLVSIIIPLFNQEHFVEKCLNSIGAQSYDNLEIIIVDDGSTDSSLQIAQKYAQDDARISLLSQKNQGVSAARNKGLEHATGHLVMFVDSDDWLELSCVAEVVETWIDTSRETGNPVAVRFGHKRGDEVVLPKEQLLSDQQCYTQLLREFDRCASSVWALLIERRLIEENSLRFNSELSRSEDVLFLAQLYKSGCFVVSYAQALYNYRVGEGLGTSLYPDAVKKADIFYNTLKSYPSLGPARDLADNEALIHYMTRFYIVSMIIESAQTNKRLETVQRALSSPSVREVMEKAASLKDLPFWAKVIAKSATRNNARAVSFYLASIQKNLLK